MYGAICVFSAVASSPTGLMFNIEIQNLEIEFQLLELMFLHPSWIVFWTSLLKFFTNCFVVVLFRNEKIS